VGPTGEEIVFSFQFLVFSFQSNPIVTERPRRELKTENYPFTCASIFLRLLVASITAVGSYPE